MAIMACKVNMGTLYQEVTIRNKKYSDKDTVETYKIPLEEIPKFIAKIEDVDTVYLSGPKPYLTKIKDETKEEEIKRYKKTKTLFVLL